MTELLGDIPGLSIYQDDILVHASSRDKHDEILRKVLHVIHESGLKLNKSKCQFRVDEIKYLGHIISKNGIKPDDAKVTAINEMPCPKCIADLRRYMGMIKYLLRFLPDMSSVAEPLNQLLKSNVDWFWGPAQEKAFKQLKLMVSKAPVLAFYNAKYDTRVSADASSFGLGAVLEQKPPEKSDRKPVVFGSRTLSDTEKRYAQIEKECLASVWACEKFDKYLRGMENFRVITDHRPLIPLMNTKSLEDVPLRCQRLLIRMRNYSYTAEYQPGKSMHISDALSRAPSKSSAREPNLEAEIRAYVASVEESFPSDQWDVLREESAKDNELRRLSVYIQHGWPNHESSVSPGLKPYYQVRNQLSVMDGVVTYCNRIVVPTSHI